MFNFTEGLFYHNRFTYYKHTNRILDGELFLDVLSIRSTNT